MALLIATVFFAAFTITQARHYPSVELFEIRDRSETRSRGEPILEKVNELNSKSDIATLAKYITKYWAFLNPPGPPSGTKSEDEGGFVDETRSSIVVVPNILNKIIKSTEKANKNSIYELLRAPSDDEKSYGKRTKRIAYESQWEIPMKSLTRRS